MESHSQLTNVLVLTVWKQTLLPAQLPQNQTKEVGKKTKDKVEQSFILLKLFNKMTKKNLSGKWVDSPVSKMLAVNA